MGSTGLKVQRIPGQGAGDCVLGEWGSGSAKAVSLLCHMDTVWPLGTTAARPVRIEDGRFYGPGSYDMKAGIVLALTTLSGLAALGKTCAGPVRLLCTGDEEIGSHASRALIEKLGQESRLVLVLEPAMPGEVVKTFRKGVGGYKIEVIGRSAHAGADHRKGINAIQEMAHQVLALQALTDYERGTTVNVGVISGGTTSNVVPERCQIEVDYRVSAAAEATRLDAAVRALKPTQPGAELKIEGSLNRPPMERDAQMIATFQKAKAIAARLDLDLQEGGTGGASDANFIAALGVPVLDGLGPDGDGGHALHEHILIDSMPRRAALLAALLTEW